MSVAHIYINAKTAAYTRVNGDRHIENNKNQPTYTYVNVLLNSYCSLTPIQLQTENVHRVIHEK